MGERKRFYKSREDKKLGGVCGGLAEYFNIDPTILRVLWALISIFYGVGIVLYIICVLIMPWKEDVIQ